MKRSTMVEFMTNRWLGLWPGDTFDQDDYNEVKLKMSALLGMLESQGMLPPSKSGWKNNPIAQEFCTWNEWEPEDETK